MYEAYNEAKLILIISTAIILLLIIVVVAALLIQQKRKFRHKQQITEMQSQYEKSLLQTELKIQGETFKAISENLHDNIGSNISTAMLLLYKDEAMAESEIETNRKEAIVMLDKIVDDLKNISRSLNPEYLNEIGLTEAIRQRIQQLEKTKKYEMDYYLDDAPRSLNIQKQLILFYVFQEAVNNITTHAKATNISVALHYEPGKLSLCIKDDGKGITETPGTDNINNKGSGLISMKHHAEMINGQLNIKSEKGKGTEIMLTVPDPYY